MKWGRVALAAAVIAVPVLLLAGVISRREGEAVPNAAPVPVLSVVLTRPQLSRLPLRVAATGNVAAWQEASVGAEADGLRLTEVRVNVGDTVRRGQVLATFNAALVEAELAEARAAVAQADAEAREADTNARRAKELDGSGAMSAQQISQYIAAARVAGARLEGARAVERKHRLRHVQTRVLAPADGIITARSATVGAVVPAGQELFRLIKDGRLEWRAAIALQDLDKLVPGQVATLALPGRPPLRGTLRMIAPAIDTRTHDGLAYVDLPRDGELRAGAFARGHFDVGSSQALTLPQGAVLLRDGFSYVLRVGPASNVMMTKVAIGRRIGERIEITAGLAAAQEVIAAGVGFLGEGDTVNVVGAHAEAPARSRP